MPRFGPSTAVSIRPSGGRLASAKSKTGNPACSQAMSEWVRGRKSGVVSAAVYAMLGKCRAQAHQLRQSQIAAAAGKGLKADALKARAARGLTGKERLELAKQKRAARGPALKPISGGAPDDVLRRGRANLANRQKLAGRIKALRASDLEQKQPETHGKTGKTYDVGTDKIHFDPDRFQYKLAAQGTHGTTGALKDVQKWDPELAGVISVWRDPANGKTYVVNGHHRLDLAKRLGVEKVAVKYLDAPNAQVARGKGAMVNIAEGRGTSVDAAKYFRDSGLTADKVRSAGLSMKEHTASEGLALAALEPSAFKRVVNGEMTPARAAIIGGSGLSEEQQRALIKVLDKPKNKRLTDGTVRNMVDAAKAAGSRKKETRDLFGTTEEEESLFIHRAKVEDSIKRKLSEDKRLFGLVSKSKAAAALEERGRSSIDLETTGTVSKEAASVLGVFDQLKHRDPRISKPLNQAAERIANGENPKTVEADTRRAITNHIKAFLEGRADVF
jgi:hypothetical protein